MWEKNFKPRPQNRIKGIKVFRGAPPSFLCPPPHPGGPCRHLHSLNKTSGSDILAIAVDCNPHFRNSLNWNHETKSSTYTTDVMAEQNDVVLEKRLSSRNFLRKKSGQRSAIDEEAVVVFCLAVYVLQWRTTVGTLQEK